jgi:hypothetical protein
MIAKDAEAAGWLPSEAESSLAWRSCCFDLGASLFNEER